MTLTTTHQEFTNLQIEFITITPNYHINVHIFVDDNNSSGSGNVYTNLRNMDTTDDMLQYDMFVYRGDEVDDNFISFSYLLKNLSVGTPYNV